MRKARPIEQIRKAEKITVKEVEQLFGIPYSTLKWYTEKGILPYTQERPKSTKYYNPIKVKERLQEIERLRTLKGLTIDQISEFYNGVNLL